VLGVGSLISDEELKRHYRKLMADNEPDKLLARGVPVEFVAIATEKIATITAAYEAIAKERSI
jgi:DnaJ like chaperone protein